MIGDAGQRARDVVHRAQRDRLDRRARAAHRRRRRAPGAGSRRRSPRPITRVHEREPVGARRRPRRARSSTRSVTFGESLANTGRPRSAADDRGDRPRASRPAIVREHLATRRCEVRAADVDLDRDEIVGARREHRRAAREVVDRCGPRATRSRGRRAARSAGRSCVDPARRRPGPAARPRSASRRRSLRAAAARACPPTARRRAT